MSNAFMVYLPALPHGKFEIERGELPWIYDQDPSSGFVATMRVVPEDDYKKLEAENAALRRTLAKANKMLVEVLYVAQMP